MQLKQNCLPEARPTPGRAQAALGRDFRTPRTVHEIVTDAYLHASPARVWEVLADFSSYKAWNPVIRSIDGTLALGARLRLCVRDGGLPRPSDRLSTAVGSFAFHRWLSLNRMRIPVGITKLITERELCWVGALPVPNMFEGEHFFRLFPDSNGGVHFIQGERYAGILELGFRTTMEKINRTAMCAVNQALKVHVEDYPEAWRRCARHARRTRAVNARSESSHTPTPTGSRNSMRVNENASFQNDERKRRTQTLAKPWQGTPAMG